jgi:hypothetical protein
VTKNPEWSVAVCDELENLLEKSVSDRTTVGGENSILFPRCNLLMILDDVMTMDPRLRQTHAARLKRLNKSLQDCVIKHSTYPGRRAAIRLLAHTSGGAEAVLIEFDVEANHDVGVVNTSWANLSCRSVHADDLLEAAVQIAAEPQTSPRILMLMFNMLVNSVTHREKISTSPLAPRLLQALLEIENREVSYYEPTSEFSGTFVSSSTPLHQRIANLLFEKLGMLDQPAQTSRFDYVCCDVAATAIFPQTDIAAPTTLPLFISDFPVKGKRIAEYQLRHYLRRLYGTQNVVTDQWFKNLADEASDQRWSIARIILAAARPRSPTLSGYLALKS